MRKSLQLLLITVLFITSCSKKNESDSPLIVPVTTLASGTVTTFAGSGAQGSVNAVGNAASFSAPNSVALSSNGFVLVADVDNDMIRAISPLGVVNTLAGSGTASLINATGTAAGFNAPNGVAVDASGNVYVADLGNNEIREITTAGVVTTFAGTGTAGFANGAATAATFRAPIALAIDATGNLYVADEGNDAIRVITPGGVVSTLAGSGSPGFANGTGSAASFNSPNSVAVDAVGNVYVADLANGLIRKIAPGGVVTTFAGSGTRGSANGTGTSASFSSPSGLAVDASNNVYVGDSNNNLIRMITPAGVVTTFAGSGATGSTNGVGTAASFNFPTGLAILNGYMYVADNGNNLIRKISL